MKDKVVVSGAGGMVGRHLTHYFVKNNIDIIKFDPHRKVQALRFIHLAAKFTDNVEVLIESNINYLLKAINYCRINCIKEFIFLSGMRVLGKINQENISETSIPVNPCLYGQTKLLGESILAQSGLNSLVIRLPGILASDSTTDILSKNLQKLKNNNNIMFTNGDKIFNNFIHVDDLSEFIFNVSIKHSNDVVNLAVSKTLTLKEILQYITKKLKRDNALSESDEETPFFNINTGKAVKDYGFCVPDAYATIEKWLNQR